MATMTNVTTAGEELFTNHNVNARNCMRNRGKLYASKHKIYYNFASKVSSNCALN